MRSYMTTKNCTEYVYYANRINILYTLFDFTGGGQNI